MGARSHAALLALAAAFALGAALVAQYGFGLAPCHLCTLQRIPYGIALVLGLLAAVTHPREAAPLLLAIALAFAADAGLAGFHLGVEQHWWESACAGKQELSGNAAGLLAKLSAGALEPACDSVPFAILGVSIAGANLIVSLALTALAAFWMRAALRNS